MARQSKMRLSIDSIWPVFERQGLQRSPLSLKGVGCHPVRLASAHRRYTNFINARGRWTGHLFQSRFASVVLDDIHLVRAVRYVSLNPVRARLVSRPEEWKWSSVRAHLRGVDDALVSVRPVLDRVPHLSELLQARAGDDFSELRRAETTGRPLGTPEFVAGLEGLLGRRIARRAPGRRPTEVPANDQLELLGLR